MCNLLWALSNCLAHSSNHLLQRDWSQLLQLSLLLPPAPEHQSKKIHAIHHLSLYLPVSLLSLSLSTQSIIMAGIGWHLPPHTWRLTRKDEETRDKERGRRELVSKDLKFANWWLMDKVFMCDILHPLLLWVLCLLQRSILTLNYRSSEMECFGAVSPYFCVHCEWRLALGQVCCHGNRWPEL